MKGETVRLKQVSEKIRVCKKLDDHIPLLKARVRQVRSQLLNAQGS